MIQKHTIDLDVIKHYFLGLQDKLCTAFTEIDSKESFKEECWQREGGGGGRTRVIQAGNIFEQGGVNFSHVYGQAMPASATAHRPELAGRSFHALGISIVMHPKNPYLPTSHANVRFFLAEKPNAEPVWWFGGGFDLTPYYAFEEDVIGWHNQAKRICDSFDTSLYPKYKAWCDDYFYIKHRQEPRGVGGLFFDDLNTPDFETCFAFTQAVGEGYLDAYLPILERRKELTYGEKERDFQLYRRGRYVEFNLVWDRGTLFGLQTGGRTESILMSMPPLVKWSYGYQIEPNSKEAELLEKYLVPRQWATI